MPVWASGPQAANIQGTIDETEIFPVLNGKAPSALPVQTQTVTRTVTTPGPVVQGPADKTPRLGVALIRRVSLSQLRSSGLAVALTVQNAKSVKLTLRRGKKIVATRTVTKSGNLSLKVKNAKKGTYVLTITGAGKASRYAVTVG